MCIQEKSQMLTSSASTIPVGIAVARQRQNEKVTFCQDKEHELGIIDRDSQSVFQPNFWPTPHWPQSPPVIPHVHQSWLPHGEHHLSSFSIPAHNPNLDGFQIMR